ncbi:MAG: hypothetical protein MJ163_03165 [Alphaproteobacteria bacterium]|nr:hypothetical protein [Alphaproteobacteria bacterium]
MSKFPILYWPYKTNGNNEYQLARKVINSAMGEMREAISEDVNLSDRFEGNPDAVVYYPVFCESTGWWGELLGSDGVIVEKMIISPECQLMVIMAESNAKMRGNHHLLAAEIRPSSGFFKKMNSSIATVTDMLATDAGTILALFSGKNQNQFVNVIESTGDSYLGCIGRY